MKSRYDLQLALAERRLPPQVRNFRLQASRIAKEREDGWATLSTQRAPGIAELLRVAQGRTNVVELGTASGWTAAALVLTDSARKVTTFDPVDRPNREDYWSLLRDDDRARIEFVELDGALGADRVADVELLFIDSSHDFEATLDEFRAWRPSLAPGAKVVFDDYTHPEFPGVARAVEELGLQGEIGARHFLWTNDS